MELIRVKRVIDEIRNTSSTKEKQEILKRNKEDDLLKLVLEYTYNDFKKYGISEKVLDKLIPEVTIEDLPPQLNLFLFLDKVAANNSNDKLKREMAAYIKFADEEFSELCRCIFLKDLKAGITTKSINKVWKDLIPEFNVQLASKFQDAKLEPGENVAVTKKLDGIRCVIIVTDEVEIFSRSGKQITGLVEIEKYFKEHGKPGMVYDGELLKRNDNDLNSGDLYRETVKIVNSKEKEKYDIEFNIFDLLSFEDFKKGKSKEVYIERRIELDKMVSGDVVKKLPVLYYGDDLTVIPGLLEKIENAGGEGLMINRNKVYECKRTKSLLKVKSFNNADVLVKEVIEGEGKNKGKLGAIIIEFEFEGNLYNCKVGSGFSDDERIEFWNNKDLILNRIVEIDYFEISKNKKDGVSLRFPTWKGRIRNDKKEISMN